MASVKGTNITNLDAVPATMANAAQVHGRMRVWHDTYEASSLASGSDITVARLPAGATVYEVVVVHDALGSSVTLSVGDASSATRYIGATAAATAGKLVMTEDGNIDGFGYENSSSTDVLVTTGGAAASGTVKTAVYYTVD